MSFEKIKRQLMADKKKLGILVMLAFVGLLLWGRLLMTDVPRTATATPKAHAAASAATAGSATGATDASGSSVTRALPEVAVDLRATVTRDIFMFHGRGYPPVPVEEKPQAKAPKPTKLVLDPADKAKEREQVIRTEATKLRVQSTILGAQPRALINGQLLAPGETIQGFELTEVRPRSVTLTKENVEIVLEM